MLTLDQIKALCFQGESNRLDFKRDQYRFDNAADGNKAELLKDLLSFANTFRGEPAYILIGVEEQESKIGKVVGIEKPQVIDGSKIQQFVNEKTNRIIPFETYVIECGDSRVVQVIEISQCLKARPFYLKQKDFVQIKKHDVWVRVGSSSHVASPDEVKEMGCQEVENDSSPTLSVKFDIDNQVEDHLLSVILQSDVRPPENSWARSLSALHGGTEYDHYLWLRNNVAKLHFRLIIENVSQVQADNLSVKYELESTDGSVEECDAPGFSAGSWLAEPRLKAVLPQKENSLRPGECDLDVDDLYFKVNGEGSFKLTTTIYGKNLRVPLRQTHEYMVRRGSVQLSPDWIKQIDFVIRDIEDLNLCVKWIVKQVAEERSGRMVDWEKEFKSYWSSKIHKVLARYKNNQLGDEIPL